MKFRELFSVPEGKTITEKNLYRVLISSICSILLCMGCLAGTTWAWFAVSIENEENVIAVASNPEVVITVNDAGFESSSNLGSGTHIVRVTHASELDDVQQKSTLYVTFSLNEGVQGYVMLNHENGYTATINITTDQECVLSWTVSWFMPDNAEPVVDNLIELRSEETEPTEESTEPTEETTESVETEKDPTEETTEPTEAETDPTEETTQPTETETDPTEETTQPTETETHPTEETIEPTEAETKPTEETTQATEAETEPTEVTTQPAETETEVAETVAVTESNTDSSGNET